MTTIRIDLHTGYDVQLAENSLARVGEFLEPRFSPRAVAVVTDNHVADLWAAPVLGNLRRHGFTPEIFVFPAGEGSKTIAVFTELVTFLAAKKLTKSDLVIALGGGIVGDLAGFAASAYLRGVNLVQLPTTLLAMVDSAVGGKTAVNLPSGKNLVGAFYQPHYVLIDPTVTQTLSPESFADGAAEIIKYGVLIDENLFAELAAGKLRENLATIIARAVAIKRDYVRGDERDEGIRQQLNLGHTFGHAIEKISNFTITHGHAVAMGMMLIARGAARRGFCEGTVAEQIGAVLTRCDLPTASPYAAPQILAAALNDKKRRGGQITLVLPRRIGECSLQKIAITELADFLGA